MADNMTAVQVLIDKGRVIGKLADRALEAKGRDCEVLGEVIDLIRKEPEVERRPAVPGHTDAYNLSELCFRNGEANMKGKLVAIVMGLQVTANSEQHRILTDLLDKLKHI